MTEPLLDIIITHHDEPWEVGKPFFDMMEHQQCVEKTNVRIILVQDGQENALPWKALLSDYSFKVKLVTIPHSGTAVARNAGYKTGSAAWVMFWNFDDMMADVCSLSMMIGNFPTDECDLIWCRMVQICKWFTGHTYLNKIDGVNFGNTCGKMYRRAFLDEHNIRFNKDSKYFYDHIFNAIVLSEVKPYRIMELTTDFYPYMKSFRQNSMKHTPEAQREMMFSFLDRDLIIIHEMEKRGLEYELKRAVAKAVCSEYYSIYDPLTQNKEGYSDGFLDFYNQYKWIFHTVSPADVDVIREEAEIEKLNLIQIAYNEHKTEMYFKNDVLLFDEWVQCLDDDDSTSEPIVHQPDEQSVSDPEPVTAHIAPDADDPKIVVYCGTYDVYMNMIASCKSLLCNVPVDKVYFLTEDDEFPYELPDIVENINVKNQQYFTPDGPNFNNSWTYMCMIRAAFPEMFPQYKKILSLDIDIVITENVSELWDYDISDYYLAGVPEKQRQKSSADPLYINFGVVMMNLEKLRQDGIQDQLITALNTTHFGCPEQDAYNKFCAGHILGIPADYNYTTYSHITGDAQKERILHYAGQKFWRHYAVVKQYADLNWDEVMRRQNALHEAGDSHE